jgi:hypothetical protein
MPDSTTHSAPRRVARTPVTGIALALVGAFLLSVPAGGTAEAESARPPARALPDAGMAVTTTSAPATSSTSGPGEEGATGSSNLTLALVLAAILVLALLPTSGYHSHGHWHAH